MELRITAALLLALLTIACTAQLATPGTDAPTARSAIAQPYYTTPPAAAIPAPPDPVREQVTAQLQQRFRDRITDLTYLAAVGQLVQTEPERLPAYLAHRNNHNSCLQSTLTEAAAITNPKYSDMELPNDPQTALRIALVSCLRQATGDWSNTSVTQRSQWLRPVLDAAARAHNPARHYATLHPDPESHPTFVELSQVYAQCEELTAARADLAAIPDQPALVAQQLELGVQDIGNCIAAATRLAWPEPVR